MRPVDLTNFALPTELFVDAIFPTVRDKANLQYAAHIGLLVTLPQTGAEYELQFSLPLVNTTSGNSLLQFDIWVDGCLVTRGSKVS